MSRVENVAHVVFDVRGTVPLEMRELARTKVASAIEHSPEPVLFVRVRLSTAPDPAVACPALAQANVDVNGRLVRVQVAAPSMRNAVHLLPDLLRERFARISRYREAGARAQDAQRRHGAEPAHRPPIHARPQGEREVVRHKTFALARQTPDETAFDMDVMDYDFHLFTDAETGQDSVLYRMEDGYRLAQLRPVSHRREPVGMAMTISPHPAARLTVKEAIERLETVGLPFVFFADAVTGRGNLLYHRFDGHYGLITPAEPVTRSARNHRNATLGESR